MPVYHGGTDSSDRFAHMEGVRPHSDSPCSSLAANGGGKVGEGMEAPAGTWTEDVPSPAAVSGEQQESQKELIGVLLTTIHHFFGSIASLFGSINDPRDSRRIRYPSQSLLFAGVLLFLFRLRARRE